MEKRTIRKDDGTEKSAGLFDPAAPLAERLRPTTLDNVVGQDHLLGKNGILRRMIASKHLPSIILWGAPGVGKTTIARLLAHPCALHFTTLSAVFATSADLRREFDQAAQRRQAGKATLLFVDEIHRFHRGQQDAFLPQIEKGYIILVGATTHNPSFALISALLSRCQVLTLRRLQLEDMETLITRVCYNIANAPILDTKARQFLANFADGDARRLINALESLGHDDRKTWSSQDIAGFLQRAAPRYDKNQDAHYNLISALHKSIRASHVDAALYWLGRMIDGGEDEEYILRRMTRIASEDVGLADPNALSQSIAAWEAWRRLGAPEGHLAIAQIVAYLSLCDKSNALYRGWQEAEKVSQSSGSLPPPLHLLNARSELMRKMGYGRDYRYDHDCPDGFSGQECFPKTMKAQEFYHPSDVGFEKDIATRLAQWRQQRSQSKQ